ncbi:hypothetical protein [Mesorhizobium sp. J8]|uniref:hypothetical protein n=1 Tax=Mesorhizobium sp. J8 TaxID=2777475 RepID=UPI001CD8C318|nr:hypothetical protein [Mesorhizobium sp. J8]
MAIAYTLPIFLGSALAIARVDGSINLPVAFLIVTYGPTLLRAVLAHGFEFTQWLISQADSERAIRRDSCPWLPLASLPEHLY